MSIPGNVPGNISANIPASVPAKVLILSAVASGGHRACAQALAQSITEFSDGKMVPVSSSWVQHICPISGKIISKIYLKLIRIFPQGWGWAYDNKKIQKLVFGSIKILSRLDLCRLKNFLEKENPQLIVCTHAFPCRMIAEQKQNGKVRIFLAALVTDFAVHSYWVHPQIDLYFVANDRSAEFLRARGIAEEKIKVTGIPIDLSFYKKIDRTRARSILGLKTEVPVLLLMGGSYGIGPFLPILKQLQKIYPPPQILLAAGTNKELKNKIHDFKNVQIQEADADISLLMDAADILISKPGGLTCAESLAKELPMVIVQAIPGQEERNAKYLCENSAALWAESLNDLPQLLQNLLNDRRELENLKKNITLLKIGHSGKKAAEFLTASSPKANTF